MKGLKQHHLDYEIVATTNPKTLVFIDSSEYYIEPERPLLEVTLPGYDKYFLVNVVARKVNTFNSNTIGLTEVLITDDLVELPDGVYQFRYKVCPYEFYNVDKVFFRTTLIEKKLSSLYTQIEASDCSKKSDELVQEDLVEIHILIEGAKAVVHLDQKKARDFYALADSLVEKLLKKMCKTCN